MQKGEVVKLGMNEEEVKQHMLLMSKQEELDPELKKYVVTLGGGIKQLKHPLVFDMILHPQMFALLNAQLKYKTEAIKDALQNKQWTKYIWLHERPYRLEAFSRICQGMSDEGYWETLGEIWRDSENLWQYGLLLDIFLDDPRPGREKMMNEHDVELLKTLPDEIRVYRGHHSKNRLGFSWSLSYWRARWFAERWQRKRFGVITGLVKKKDIIALFLGRREMEIVANPRKVVQIVSFNTQRWENTQLLSLAMEGCAGLPASGRMSEHGVWHWLKVHWNVQKLCKLVPGADPEVCKVFAYLHDCKRTDEVEGCNHGALAAEFAVQMAVQGKLPLSSDQLDKLSKACIEHENCTVSDDPTIGVCWDADRLDLPRVNVIIKPELLSTQAAKDLCWKI